MENKANNLPIDQIPFDQYYGLPLEKYEALIDYVDAGNSEE